MRLPWPAVAVLGGAALAVGLAARTPHGPDPPALVDMLGAWLAAWATAALAARWLGGGLGLAAGLAMSLGAGGLLGLLDPWICASAAAAIGLFARARVPGRLACDPRRIARAGAFAILGIWLVARGPGEPATVWLVCLAYLLVGQDTRGLGRFALSAGTILLAVALAARWWACQRGWLGGDAPALDPSTWLAAVRDPADTLALLGRRLAVALFPWSPLAIVAIVAGVRQGHHAAPFWRLVGCWAIVPAGAAVLGWIDARSAVSLAAPAWAVLAAAGHGAASAQTRRALRFGAVR